MKKVFLLQDTKEENEELQLRFSLEQDFSVVGRSTNGEKAMEQIKELNPDVLIINLILAGSDGLSVIRKIRKENTSMKIIVLSFMTSEEIVSMAISAGANYFMAKPCGFGVLKQRILELFNEKAEKEMPIATEGSSVKISMDEKISKIFISVGIPPHIKGYGFLREGVKLAMEQPEMINNITKKLYPKIGEKFDTTPSKVERAIRHAIEVAWARGRIETINNILGVQAYVNHQKPTNGEFIALVADKMLLEKTR